MRKLVARQRRAEQRAQEALAELARLKSAPAAAAAPREASKPKLEPLPPAAVRAPEPAPIAPVAPAAPSITAPPPAPAAQNLALRHLGSGQVIAIDASRSEFLIGRPDPVTGIQPEINLGPFDASRTLSRRHAKLLREGGLYFLREEVGTANGTFVDGERIKTGATIPLKPGTKLRFGSIEVELIAA